MVVTKGVHVAKFSLKNKKAGIKIIKLGTKCPTCATKGSNKCADYQWVNKAAVNALTDPRNARLEDESSFNLGQLLEKAGISK